MPNKLFSLPFPFIPRTTLPSVLWLILLFLFGIPPARFLPLFLLSLYLNASYLYYFQDPVFVPISLNPFLTVSPLTDFSLPWNPQLIFYPLSGTWPMLWSIVIYVFYIHYVLLFSSDTRLQGDPWNRRIMAQSIEVTNKNSLQAAFRVCVCPGC